MPVQLVPLLISIDKRLEDKDFHKMSAKNLKIYSDLRNEGYEVDSSTHMSLNGQEVIMCVLFKRDDKDA